MRLHVAMRDRPALLRMQNKALPDEGTGYSTAVGAPAAESGSYDTLSIEALLGRPRTGGAPVTIDEAHADPKPLSAFYAGVIGDCLERMAMLGRHRRERPLVERPEIEARLLAQLDAIAAAGARPADLQRFWDDDVEDDAFMLWAAAFALGSFEGAETLSAIQEMIEALPDEGNEAAVLAAEALLLSPHPEIAVLARKLLASASPLARAAGVELSSRSALLAPQEAAALLGDASPAVIAAAIRALARDTQGGAAAAKVVHCLDHADAEVAWEAARAITVWGQLDAYQEVREGGRLADTLGVRALEILVLAGELADIDAMQRIVKRLPVSEAVLDAVARFGHPGTWDYLVHHLDHEELGGAAEEALVTLFGSLVEEERAADAAARRDTLANRKPSQEVRLRRGEPWSISAVVAECRGGDLTRHAAERRIDELQTRTRVAGGPDLALWSSDAALVRLSEADWKRATPRRRPGAIEERRAVPDAVAAVALPLAVPTATPRDVTKAPGAAVSEVPDWLPRGMLAFTDMHSTQIVHGSPPAGPALPFDPSAAPTLPEPSETPEWVPKGMRAFAGIHGTELMGTLPAPEGPPAGPVLPFEPSALPKLPPPGEIPAWMPMGMRRFLDVSGTQTASGAPAGPGLPFTAPGALDATAPMSLDELPPITDPLPGVLSEDPSPVGPQAPPAPGAPSLTVEQYASLCVELELYPAHESIILQRYGLDANRRREIDASWRARTETDASLRMSLEKFRAAYRAWLVGPRNAGR